jgi:hypothetical protein
LTKKKTTDQVYFCPNDPGHKMQSRGEQIYCNDCDEFFEKKLIDETVKDDPYSFSTDGRTAVVTAGTDEEIRNVDDLIRVCKIDTKEWRVDRHTVGVNSAYRKLRKSKYTNNHGDVVAQVEDTGKILRAPMYNVKAWLVRKTEEIRETGAIQDLIEEAKKVAPKVPKIKYPKLKDGCIFEIDMFDFHFGKLTWGEETGHDYDIKIARDMAFTAIGKLLNDAKNHNVSQILLPWGQDFFNVDTIAETTTGGTPQQEDTRWKKTFKAGRILTQDIVKMCTEVAPVDILFIPGNHDTARLFYLGEAIDCAFANNPNVKVDNGPRTRKYRHYDQVLLGFCHGYNEKLEMLPTQMSIDAKEAWAQASIREWHTGDKHHKLKLELRHEERIACTVRILSSLSGTDAWHFDHHYTGNIREANAFLWHPKYGLQAEYHGQGEYK